jgi:hypothetical protein
MNTMFIARSLTFYPGYFDDNCTELSDEIILPSYTLNKLMERFDDNEILYINLQNTETNLSYLVTIGTPHNYDKNTIFAPQWILDQIGCDGNCDSVITLNKADVSDIPPATKIIIKPLDPIAFEIDTLELFEKALMNLHSIKENITIPIPVPQLGKDYSLFAHIEKVEPIGISRIINGEVDVEFINEFTHTGFDALVNTTTSSELNPVITPNITPALAPTPASNLVPEIDEKTAEERRRIIRESWVKRFENTSRQQ